MSIPKVCNYSKSQARKDWRRPVSDVEAARRAGGRTRYNARRRVEADFRRLEIVRLWDTLRRDLGMGPFDHGVQAEIARRLRVHPSTVSRDYAAIYQMWAELAVTDIPWDGLDEIIAFAKASPPGA